MDTETTSSKALMYEYKEIKGKNTKLAFLLDCYESFGWEIDGHFTEEEEIPGRPSQIHEKIVLKRPRKIINKTELTRLQRNFESCLAEIAALEKSKISSAQVASLSVGIVGTAFMAGSVFAITAPNPMWVLGIILAVPAFIGWIVPYFLYRKIIEKKEAQITPLIEAKYDEIYAICEKGSKLLYN